MRNDFLQLLFPAVSAVLVSSEKSLSDSDYCMQEAFSVRLTVFTEKERSLVGIGLSVDLLSQFTACMSAEVCAVTTEHLLTRSTPKYYHSVISAHKGGCSQMNICHVCVP